APPPPPVTVIENAGSETLVSPSLTVMTMLLNVPELVGVPLSRPVDELNVAQDGRFSMENPSVSPSGSDAFGVNEYGDPTVAEVGGEPLIVGARFAAAGTSIENAGNEALARPSLTRMTMLAYLPT